MARAKQGPAILAAYVAGVQESGPREPKDASAFLRATTEVPTYLSAYQLKGPDELDAAFRASNMFDALDGKGLSQDITREKFIATNIDRCRNGTI